MAEGQDESTSKKMNITVKTPKEKHNIEIGDDASVKEVSIFIKIITRRSCILKFAQ